MREQVTDVLALALEYASRGWRVFPVRGKVPATQNGFHDATLDTARIVAWWDSHPELGIGIATGSVSGIVVLDVDGQKGFACLQKYMGRFGSLPATPCSHTGGGGWHAIFQYPTGRTIKSSVAALGDGLDIRADGGYIVAPPTLHPSGNPYKWAEQRPLSMSLAPCPEWLLEQLAQRSQRLGPTLDVETQIPEGQRNNTLASLAGSIRRIGADAEEILSFLLTVNAKRCKPPYPEEKVAAIARSISRYEPAEAIGRASDVARTTYTGPATRLGEVTGVFQKWLHLPDPGPLHIVLGAIAANLIPGDSVWLLLVAPPASGKTEILQACSGLERTYPVSTLTVASLLSGVSRKQSGPSATGGLLRKIGEDGTIIVKDWGSILSMRTEQRGEVFAALREIYDGQWVRQLGVDGGRELTWTGRVSVLAGGTPAVDEHQGSMASLGERLLYYRFTPHDRVKQGEMALTHMFSEEIMRTEMREAVQGLFAGIDVLDPASLSPDEKRRIVALSSFVATARSPVVRDRYTREIEIVPAPEGPARLVFTLARLYTGLTMIGLAGEDRWGLIVKAAFDSMPSSRLRAFQFLISRPGTCTTSEVSSAIGLPTVTTRRILEDLAAHFVVTKTSGGEGRADLWGPWSRSAAEYGVAMEGLGEDFLNGLIEAFPQTTQATDLIV